MSKHANSRRPNPFSAFERPIAAFGNRENPPILFLHGIRLGGAIWETHARYLSDEFFVVTPDLPGHGSLADLPFDAPTLDAFLAYIADNVVSGPPLIVGYSLGGYVAMRYAADLPERTSGLVLSGASANIVGWRRALYTAAVRASALVPDAMMQRLLTMLFRITLPRRVADAIIPFRFNHKVFEQSLRIAGGIRYSDLLARYGKPVLLVNGKWDLLFRRDERLFAAAAGAKVVVMSHTDHVAPLREPERFCALVRDFAHGVLGQTAHRASG